MSLKNNNDGADHISTADRCKQIMDYPLANTGGRSGLFFAFLGAAGLGEGDVEKDRDL